MLFGFNLKSVTLLIFFFHGLVFSLLLLGKGIHRGDRSARWLSSFVFLCVLYIAPFMLGYAGWYSRVPYREILFYIPFQHLLLIPPVLYFYFQTVLDQSFTFRTRDYLHFIPAVGYLFYSLAMVIIDKLILSENFFYRDERDKDFEPWYQVAGFISLVCYLAKSFALYSEYRSIARNTISFADAVRFTWIRRFLISLSALLLIRLLFFVINPEWAAFGRKYWYYLSFSLLFYGLSIGGYVNTIRSSISFSQFKRPEEEPEISEDTTTGDDLPLITRPEFIPQREDTDLVVWKDRIEQIVVNEKLYENQALSVYQLAELLHTHPKKISQVVNQGFGMNFNDYVNQQRVNAIIRKLQAGEHGLQTLLSLAFESGFNSKSTFNRAFRKVTGQTPNEFIKKSL